MLTPTLIFSGLLTATVLLERTGADETAVTSTVTSANPTFPADGTRGWLFTPKLAPEQQMVVTALGVFDPGGAGLQSAHQVGIWEVQPEGVGVLVASAQVPAGPSTELIAGYRYASLSPFIPLPFGKEFAIGAYYVGGILMI